MIGTIVSHYKIIEKLGEGGMGIVYKAHDTKLDRDVALKFLPHHLTATADEQARFLQEARAASALNHPNICAIHSIGEDADRQFIEMEYVDGKTLRQLVPIQKTQIAIDYAIQIGEALQEAHSKGIVHRDVKTDNIMVNSKNQIKVMDFGLAKLKGSLKLTKTSSTVGTLAYMAPEQIQGGEVDARSDIFSFGVVLYEMVTGHMPFRGEHEAAMVYSIVNEEPTPIQKYLPDVSSELMHVLNRALEKDPSERYQSVAEMVIDLRRLKKQTSRVSRSMTAEGIGNESQERAGGAPHGKVRRSKTKLALIAVSTLIVGAAAVFLLTSRDPELNPDMQFKTIQIPFRSVWYTNVSEDGNWLVFPAADDRGKYDVYIMNVSGGQPRRVTFDSSEYIYGVQISPDASTILYGRRRIAWQPLEMVSVPTNGGRGRVILDTARAARWQPDGKRISYVVTSQGGSSRLTHEFWTARPDGTDRRFEFADTLEPRASLREAWAYSPDGKEIAWTRNFPGGYTEIIVRELQTGKERQLTFDKKTADDAHWTRNGQIAFSSNRGGNINLWIVSSSGGTPVQLTRGSGPDVPLWISPDCSRLIYSETQYLGHIRLGDLRTGSVRQLTVDERLRSHASISPTGAFIAYAEREDEYSAKRDIFVMERSGMEIRKLTDGPDMKGFPQWSRDEKWITYSAFHPNEPPDSMRTYLLKLDNPGQAKLVGRGSSSCWFSDKDFIVWSGGRSYRGSIQSTGLTAFREDSVWLCPMIDGKYMVLYDNHVGREGAKITTMQSYQAVGLKEARLWGTGIVVLPAFAKDGREFYYTEPGGARDLHRVTLPDGKDKKVGLAFPGLRSDFTVREDGKELAYTEFYRKTRFVIIDNLFK
jgi:serine/threonine protein kinase/Tol biopolymer transport system component